MKEDNPKKDPTDIPELDEIEQQFGPSWSPRAWEMNDEVRKVLEESLQREEEFWQERVQESSSTIPDPKPQLDEKEQQERKLWFEKHRDNITRISRPLHPQTGERGRYAGTVSHPFIDGRTQYRTESGRTFTIENYDHLWEGFEFAYERSQQRERERKEKEK